MSSIEITDPVLLDTFTTDSKGRVTLGERFGNSTVKICLVEVSDDAE